jgi:CRISPR-associated protein Csh1
MIKELVNFTKNLDEDFKNQTFKPSKGLHIFVKINDHKKCVLETYSYYDEKNELDDFLIRALFYERYSSYIDMNKQQRFDPKQKVHSSSPFAFAFNFSLGNNKKEIEENLKANLEKKDSKSELDKKSKAFKIDEVLKSIDSYFHNAIKLCLQEANQEILSQISIFKEFCKVELMPFLKQLKIQEVDVLDILKEKDYIRVSLISIENSKWINSYNHYFESVYPNNELKDSDFLTTFSDKKPFLKHQTATFDIGSKLSGSDLKILNQFTEVLSSKNPKLLPNPLPIFIFKEELQNRAIGLFNEDRSLKFKELCQKLFSYEEYKDDFGNYYLLNWSVGKDIRINDLDFVSKFEFEFRAVIQNLLEIKEKDSKDCSKNIVISNIFELEQEVFSPLIQNKYNSVDYFTNLEEIKGGSYENLTKTYLSFTKYRKPIYDFVYKSKKQGITTAIFYELVFNRIKDDIKTNRPSYTIKQKLNIWFSLYEKFDQNNTNEKNMASKLKEYQDFVAQLSMGNADLNKASDQHYAFATGQLIEYVIQKSSSENKSYQLLEPYLQKAKCIELKKAIASDIAKYKHAIKASETRFKSVCDFVLTYETDANMKDLLPELLAGIFSKNQFFHKSSENQ